MVRLHHYIVQLTEKGVIGDTSHNPRNPDPDDHNNPVHRNPGNSDRDNDNNPAHHNPSNPDPDNDNNHWGRSSSHKYWGSCSNHKCRGNKLGEVLQLPEE